MCSFGGKVAMNTVLPTVPPLFHRFSKIVPVEFLCTFFDRRHCLVIGTLFTNPHPPPVFVRIIFTGFYYIIRPFVKFHLWRVTRSMKCCIINKWNAWIWNRWWWICTICAAVRIYSLALRNYITFHFNCKHLSSPFSSLTNNELNGSVTCLRHVHVAVTSF